MDATGKVRGDQLADERAEHGDAYTVLAQRTGTISEQEDRRLQQQSDVFAQLADWTLDALELALESSLLEVGCGNGNLLAGAAERIGPGGRIVGVDRDPRSLEVARARMRPFPWVEVAEADALTYHPDRPRFDAVHCRLVLMHQHAPDDLVARMVALTRSGGRVAAQEYDADDIPCYPRFPAWERMIQAGLAALRYVGADPQAGRKLVDRFSRAGLRDLRVEANTPYVLFNDPRLRIMLDAFAPVGGICERAGIMPAAEYDALAAEARAAHDDATYARHLVRLPTMVAVVGQAPM